MPDPLHAGRQADVRRTIGTIAGHVRVRARGRAGRLVVAALLVAALVQLQRSSSDRADDAASAWGPATETWVTLVDIPAGALIEPDAVARRALPPVAVPADAVTASPVGRRSADALAAGEVLREGRLSDGAAGPLAAQLRAGEGIVSIGAVADHLTAGDTVDLHALLDGARVAERARVIDVRDGVAIVAVAREQLDAVIDTFGAGDVVAVLVG